MPRLDRLARLALLFTALAAGAARAETAAPDSSADTDPQVREQRENGARLQKTLFGAEAPKVRSRACFTRLYDAAHLKAHPYQHVVEIRISAHYDPVERKRNDIDAPRSKWGYALRGRLRDGKINTYRDDGSCSFAYFGPDYPGGPDFQIRCNGACDSGDDFVIAPDGKTAKLRNKDDLVHPEYTEPGAPEKLAAKADDRVFRLYRASDALCDFDKP